MDLMLNNINRVFIGYSICALIMLGALVGYYGITGTQYDNRLYLATIPAIMFTVALLIQIMYLDLKE